MPQFLLLLHESPTDNSGISPAEIQAVIDEYRTWRDRIESEDRLVGGEKLKDGEGRSLSGTGTALRVVDGPFAEAKEVIGGFFQIKARDYDDAVAVSKDCPHLRFGGRIELREIDLLED